MAVPVLDTLLARSPAEYQRWAKQHFAAAAEEGEGEGGKDMDWWAVKSALGNGGKDVWITNRNNFEEVASQVPQQGELVIQKYVNRPQLWRGKKFHLRCYAMILADLSALFYDKCYILAAGLPYQTDTADMHCHITNLSVNKHLPGYPGQVPCHLPSQFPKV
jgi:hypothetical protein